jgi:hypothetical protein
MSTAKALVAVVLLVAGIGIACEGKPAAPPAPAAQPVKVPPPAPPVAASPDAGRPKPKMVANPDGLSLADRIAKRQAEEKKLADQLAADEKQRLLKYDKTKLPMHSQVYMAIKKTRGQYDALEKKIGAAPDKAKAKADVEKLAGTLQAPIQATAKKMASIDPKGGNSNVVTDYDVMLNSLANDYPEAMVKSIDGDPKPLAEQKAELDKREKKIDGWLAELKKTKK